MAATSIGGGAVVLPLVALLSGIELPIAAKERNKSAPDAGKWGGRIKKRRFALLTDELLDDAVAADALFQLAVTSAAVEVPGIAIVALFLGTFEDEVAAA